MKDIVEQLTELSPEGYYDLVPLCQAHGVNLAYDNMGGDSDREGYGVQVVTPHTDPLANFAGPRLRTGEDEPFPDSELIMDFLKKNNVVAVFNSAELVAYSLEDYVHLVGG